MSFLLLQILLCLLIAGLIGAVIGWLLRGDCSKKIKTLEEECEMKMRSVEREWNTKLNYPQEQKIYDTSLDLETQTDADLKNQIQNKLNLTDELPDTSSYPSQNTVLSGMVAATLGATGVKAASSEKLDFSAIKKLLSEKGVALSDEKIKLYDSFDVDFEKSEDLRDVYDIQEVKGINSKFAKKFRDLGINTTFDLIKNLENNYEDIDFVAKKLEVPSEDIISWISRADILRLPGVSAKESQLIQTVGISSAKELGVININSLREKLIELNKKTEIVDEVPGINSLELWSKVAKLF